MLLQIYEGVKPTLGELEKFEATPEEVEVEGIYSCTYISMFFNEK